MSKNSIQVTFPGELKVQAQIDGFTINTDQPVKSGGEGTAPSPFTLFASSIATCAGYFALKFCRARKISTDGMEVSLDYAWDQDLKKFPKMVISLKLPTDFPEKYHKAILRSVDQCVVKQHIIDPPEFEVDII